MSNKLAYECQSCGALHAKWAGQCPDCSAWNTLVESAVKTTRSASARFSKHGGERAVIQDLPDLPLQEDPRLLTGSAEMDRVLGGGLVPGSVVLIGGDPGIGKSTLLLQLLSQIAGRGHKTRYVSGEESLRQIGLRAGRLSIESKPLRLLTETNAEVIVALAEKEAPSCMVIDSIQTVYSDMLASAPGSVAQVRETAALMVRFAKRSGMILLLVGHVTKEGVLAGPRVLEHMVDTVLYFEGDSSSRYRLIRAIKNRFGAVNELGVFAMTDKGLREVSNPSAIFLSRRDQNVTGSVIMVTKEGTRPLLVEVQALLDESHLAQPRRVTVGLDPNRLGMLLAVLHRHAGIVTYNQDVFVNVVGGVRIDETGIDLPVLFAVVSSLRNQPLPRDLVAFGEIGLGGEIRPVVNGPERLKEAAKHGFARAIVAKENAPREAMPGLDVIPVTGLQQALDAIG